MMQIESACACNIGLRRRNNEDNFYFDKRCLEAENEGLEGILAKTTSSNGEHFFAVFDGMGGEAFGEVASYTAAKTLEKNVKKGKPFLKEKEQFLYEVALDLNRQVFDAGQERGTDHMGSTLVMLYFIGKEVYLTNLGDSRGYRLRGYDFYQISQDHVEDERYIRGSKPGLIQFLGMDPERYAVEPFLTKGRIEKGDKYLICSDGVTDMLNDDEICEIMASAEHASACVERLIEASLERGGRDNTTAIVCFIK